MSVKKLIVAVIFSGISVFNTVSAFGSEELPLCKLGGDHPKICKRREQKQPQDNQVLAAKPTFRPNPKNPVPKTSRIA